MFKRSVMTFIVGLLLASIVVGAVGYSRALSAETGWLLQGALKQEAQVEEISGYRQWARVTPEPQLVISPSGLD